MYQNFKPHWIFLIFLFYLPVIARRKFKSRRSNLKLNKHSRNPKRKATRRKMTILAAMMMKLRRIC
jgi:hypothetical protein